MPKVVRGKLSFERNFRVNEKGTREQIAIYDCHPPPQGTRQRFNPATEVPVEIVQASLQPREAGYLIQFAIAPGQPPNLGLLLNGVLEAFSIRPLTIDLAKLPAWGQGVVPCEISSIAYLVHYGIYAIQAYATEELTAGGETFPAGDLVASFLVRSPEHYQFEQTLTRNPRCCPTTEDTGPRTGQVSELLPEFSFEGFPLEFDLTPRLRFTPRFYDTHELWREERERQEFRDFLRRLGEYRF